jgi:hypothetical protein
MAFYYNPVSGEIQKVSKPEKAAYDEHFREERWTKLLDNESTLPTIIGTATALFVGGAATTFVLWLIGKLEEGGAALTQESKDAISSAKYGTSLVTNIIVKPLTGQGDQPVPLPPGASAPVSVTYNEVIEYGLDKLGLSEAYSYVKLPGR